MIKLFLAQVSSVGGGGGGGLGNFISNKIESQKTKKVREF